MIWAKLAIPAAMATVGTGAFVTAAALPDRAVALRSVAYVWIDGPTGAHSYDPGTIPVFAHGTADDTISGLDLYVDGTKVVEDQTLVRNDKLVYGTFAWKAQIGVHKLVVRQVGGAEANSAPITVIVGDLPAPNTSAPPEVTVPTTTTGPSTTTSTNVVDSTTTTRQAGPGEQAGTRTTGPRSDQATIPPAGNGPGPVPPPLQAPAFDSASLQPAPSARVYAQSSCPYSVTVSAVVRNADYVQLEVEGTGAIETMARNGNAYSFTLSSGAQWSGQTGSHLVILTAGGNGTSVQRSAGTLQVEFSCKD